jgi:hypothetical protein
MTLRMGRCQKTPESFGLLFSDGETLAGSANIIPLLYSLNENGNSDTVRKSSAVHYLEREAYKF